MKYLLNCRSFIFLMVLFSFFDNLGMKKYDYIFKVVFVGDAGVGKTQIISRYVKNSFEEEYKTTTDANYILKSVEYNGKFIQLQLLDSPGDKQFRYITLGHNKDAHLIVFVYAVDNKNSFDNIQSYVDDVKNYTNKKTKFLLVGNKCDLKKEESVSTEEAQEYAKKNEMEFIEVSAKERTNINDMFNNSLKKILEDKKKVANNNLTNNNTHNFEQKDLLDDQDIDDIKIEKTSCWNKYCSCCPCLKKN